MLLWVQWQELEAISRLFLVNRQGDVEIGGTMPWLLVRQDGMYECSQQQLDTGRAGSWTPEEDLAEKCGSNTQLGRTGSQSLFSSRSVRKQYTRWHDALK
jgi:hypothetical protein